MLIEKAIRYEGASEGWVATITNPTRQGGIVSSESLLHHARKYPSKKKLVYYFGTLLGCLPAGIIGDRYVFELD